MTSMDEVTKVIVDARLLDNDVGNHVTITESEFAVHIETKLPTSFMNQDLTDSMVLALDKAFGERGISHPTPWTIRVNRRLVGC